jgi:hypothetical protein
LIILIGTVLDNYYMLLMILFEGIKITALEESADFTTHDTKKLFSKLKSHELARKGRSNHDAFFSNKALITSARVGGHDANPPTPLSHLLSSLPCHL